MKPMGYSGSMMRSGLAIAVLFSLAGCASLVRNASDTFAHNLGAAILNSEDPATVRDGLPAYLLLLDSLIAGQKPGEAGNAPVLLAAARLNGAYAGNFTDDDKPRAQRLAKKSFDYASRAVCLQDAPLCGALEAGPEQFVKTISVDATTPRVISTVSHSLPCVAVCIASVGPGFAPTTAWIVRAISLPSRSVSTGTRMIVVRPRGATSPLMRISVPITPPPA